jgi:hypothetical protein
MLNRIKLVDIGGWIGLILIQGSVIPTTTKALIGLNPQLPPIDMVAMVWVGLWLFTIRAVAQRDVLYILSSGIGAVLQTILLFVCLRSL